MGSRLSRLHLSREHSGPHGIQLSRLHLSRCSSPEGSRSPGFGPGLCRPEESERRVDGQTWVEPEGGSAGPKTQRRADGQTRVEPEGRWAGREAVCMPCLSAPRLGWVLSLSL